jgi:hypothetical protein
MEFTYIRNTTFIDTCNGNTLQNHTCNGSKTYKDTCNMTRLLNGNCNRNTAPKDAATKILSLMMSQQKYASDCISVRLPHTPQ